MAAMINIYFDQFYYYAVDSFIWSLVSKCYLGLKRYAFAFFPYEYIILILTLYWAITLQIPTYK